MTYEKVNAAVSRHMLCPKRHQWHQLCESLDFRFLSPAMWHTLESLHLLLSNRCTSSRSELESRFKRQLSFWQTIPPPVFPAEEIFHTTGLSHRQLLIIMPLIRILHLFNFITPCCYDDKYNRVRDWCIRGSET